MEKRENKCFSIVAVLLHLKEYVNERIADFFAWWAEIVFDHPYKCLIATLFITIACCIGFIPGIPKWIDGADALYSLPFSVAKSQGAIHKVLFNETNSRPTFIIITGKNPGENVFTWEHLDAVKQLDRLIRGQIVDPQHGRRVGIARSPEYNQQPDEQKRKPRFPPPSQLNALFGSELPLDAKHLPENISKVIDLINNPSAYRNRNDRGDAGRDILTFQDICVRNPFGDCTVTGIQEMGIYETRELLLKPGDPPVLLVFDGLVFNTQKRAFPPHYVLGKAKEIPCSPELPRSMLTLMYSEDRLMPGSAPNLARVNMTCIREAQAFQVIYEVQENDALTRRNEDWEKVVVEVLSDNMEFGPLSVSMNAFRSRDDALRSSTSESSDVLYVGLTFGFLLAYSTGLNFSCDLYRSKAYPALAGLLAATLGLIAGMGAMSLCGVAFVPTALVCPFLVIGVGTDDLFVIINGYAMTYMVDSAKYRCIITLRETGIGITMTTVTSLVSFLIGLNTGYLSIKNFCWFCGASMFFGYIYVFTFFFPVHCLDARREEENQACLFCVPRDARREARREELRKEGVEVKSGADIGIFTLGALMVRRAEQKALRRHAIRNHLKELQAVQQHPASKNKRSITKNEHTHDETKETQLTQPMQMDQGGTGSTILDADGGIEIVMPKKLKLIHLPQLMLQRKEAFSRKSYMPITMIRWMISKIIAGSDQLLSRVALEGHDAGLKYGVDESPSHGVLDFSRRDPEMPSTGDPMVDILNHPHVALYYRSLLTGERKLFLEEPKGNVGLKWHQFFIRYYGAFLVHPWCKTGVFCLFGMFMALSLYGCLNLESGLDLRDLAPIGSYLNKFDINQARFFDEYDFPVDLFFPRPEEWWKPEAQQTLRILEKRMKATGSGKLATNPVIKMLDDPELKPFLQSGERETFESALYTALSKERSKYKQFEQNFVWEGTHLRAWKMQILPAPMFSSSERATWMTKIRQDCEAQMNSAYPVEVMAWNYMMTFYESDLQINSSVTSNMLVAAATMLVIAVIGIPEFKAGFLVTLVMGMIDVGIIGFMYFWGVKLNMVSMICLLIAVGFSVDFSAHVCHTYMEAEGETRNQRVIEALVIMGNPVCHGAASSILGILMLGFSASYIFRVFFKMMTLVMVFALSHGVVFLPVLLSVASDVRPHHAVKQLITSKPPVKTNTLKSKRYDDDDDDDNNNIKKINYNHLEKRSNNTSFEDTKPIYKSSKGIMKTRTTACSSSSNNSKVPADLVKVSVETHANSHAYQTLQQKPASQSFKDTGEDQRNRTFWTKATKGTVDPSSTKCYKSDCNYSQQIELLRVNGGSSDVAKVSSGKLDVSCTPQTRVKNKNGFKEGDNLVLSSTNCKSAIQRISESCCHDINNSITPDRECSHGPISYLIVAEEDKGANYPLTETWSSDSSIRAKVNDSSETRLFDSSECDLTTVVSASNGGSSPGSLLSASTYQLTKSGEPLEKHFTLGDKKLAENYEAASSALAHYQGYITTDSSIYRHGIENSVSKNYYCDSQNMLYAKSKNGGCCCKHHHCYRIESIDFSKEPHSSTAQPQRPTAERKKVADFETALDLQETTPQLFINKGSKSYIFKMPTNQNNSNSYYNEVLKNNRQASSASSDSTTPVYNMNYEKTGSTNSLGRTSNNCYQCDSISTLSSTGCSSPIYNKNTLKYGRLARNPNHPRIGVQAQDFVCFEQRWKSPSSLQRRRLCNSKIVTLTENTSSKSRDSHRMY